MNIDQINKAYWTCIRAGEIIGDNASPSDELLQRLQAGARILDIGCGRGAVASMLVARGFKVTAIDVNTEAIEEGKQRKDGAAYMVADCTEPLPFPNHTFDAVVLSFVLVNISKRERGNVVAEISRVLKPGGYAWVNEGTASDAYALRYELARPYVDEDRTFFVFKNKNTASSIASADDLKNIMEAGGVSRLAHHFTEQEIRELFSEYICIHSHKSVTASPRTQMKIEMVTAVFQRKQHGLLDSGNVSQPGANRSESTKSTDTKDTSAFG